MQTVKHATVLALIVLPLTLGVFLAFQALPPASRPAVSTPTTRAEPPSVPVISTQPTLPPPPEDPLLAINGVFRGAYAAGRKQMLEHTGPVLLVEGDSIVRLHNGERVESLFTPPVYHDLKAIAHVPLAVFVLLTPYGDGPLSGERLAAVRRYRELIPSARSAVAKRGFSGPVLERQYQILDESAAFLNGVLERKQINTAEVTAFTRRMGPQVMENANEAARAQIDGLHARVMAWRKEMRADEWRQVRVVVMGSHMPREGNLAMQYFTRVLDEPVDDRRLMYAESLWDEKKALDLLGTSVLDTRIGADFFGDELRMHRDLLADAARAYVKRLAIPPLP